ncbi:uncharacterized protein EAF02_008810 [Botrytis sinoallii]|uniref:uncharacterized protein n=1 Tax=Botrytis sinoallii TaxID=1463999 RepID=UPI0019020485|nr:uncharacterized protein EAF02_008810 [Botrytis sinoallii]KAF7872739.1 hypothetical protein EAF02_008810 [Botrytis sinoallii]
MAAHRRQRSHLPSPPISPSQQTPRPLPLPLPTEMTKYKNWQTARSSSMNIKNVPVAPLARRSATAPVIGTTSDKFIDYDRSSSPESEPFPKRVVQSEVPSRYTTSYYHILGLPESPDVTTEEIEEAFQNLISNPSSHPSHHYDNLERIRKTLTSSIRRRTYDHGRRAHLLHQSQLQDRERFEQNHNDSDNLSEDRLRFEKMRNDCDNLSKARKTTAREIKVSTENMGMKSLESELKMVKKEVAATFKRKVKDMGLSMSLDGLDEEEGVPWEEMDFGTRSSQIVGERMGLEFEFNGSGSEEDSGGEDGSEGTFSDGEEEQKEPRRSEESEQIKRLEEFEELSVSAMSGLFSKISSSELEETPIAPEMISKDDQEKLDVKEDRLSASEETAPIRLADSYNIATASPLAEITSKSEQETPDIKDADEKIPDFPNMTPEIISKSEPNRELVETKIATQEIPGTLKPTTSTTPTTSPPPIDTDLPNILTIVELLYPTPLLTPEVNPKKKKEKNSCKEIWEFDYNSESEYASASASESESDTEPSLEELRIPPASSSPSPSPKIHELPGSEIWELDYPNHNPTPTREQEKEEEHETIILFLQFVIVFSLATAAWGWFGGGWVLNLVVF